MDRTDRQTGQTASYLGPDNPRERGGRDFHRVGQMFACLLATYIHTLVGKLEFGRRVGKGKGDM